jgi:hypothetical protein
MTTLSHIVNRGMAVQTRNEWIAEIVEERLGRDWPILLVPGDDAIAAHLCAAGLRHVDTDARPGRCYRGLVSTSHDVDIPFGSLDQGGILMVVRPVRPFTLQVNQALINAGFAPAEVFLSGWLRWVAFAYWHNAPIPPTVTMPRTRAQRRRDAMIARYDAMIE